MLTHECVSTCDPVSILYLPVFSKLQVLRPDGGYSQVDLLY